MFARPYLTAGITAVLSLVAAAAYANSSAQEFVRKASIANRFEIESSRLALEKSQDGEIREFAQRMVDDHTMTGEKLGKTLDSANLDIQPATALDSKHEKLMDKLQAASGDNFNREYIAVQTDAHKEAVTLFSGYANNGDNAALKNFASQTLPSLKDHLEHVQTLQSKQ